ncbi:hypothetical protein [Hyphomicrobium sp. D-2]|uniref:hypothetical protein n=1 Tax=Hyphomicrobium sp. D-2 TaxID=3041621 RepID=UPI002458E75D|nr:hypothetical protein [Hyphomicrobium sp. D-2]MDH4983272.1 hypothetical protein [Hyphomicrobium sp. D-2]
MSPFDVFPLWMQFAYGFCFALAVTVPTVLILIRGKEVRRWLQREARYLPDSRSHFASSVAVAAVYALAFLAWFYIGMVSLGVEEIPPTLTDAVMEGVKNGVFAAAPIVAFIVWNLDGDTEQ